MRARLQRLYDLSLGRLSKEGRWLLATVGAAGVAFGLGGALGAWTHLCDNCPSIAQIYAFEPKEATRLYAIDGSLVAELAVERRTPIELADLPPHVYEPFIAVEDRRFWGHHGVDVRRFVKAVADFALQGYDAAGGSTITQQLAGNMFSAVDRQDISVRRKLREMKVAFALERAYTKREILEAYLNQINFDGVFGIQAAALHYFGRDAAELNLPEAALLAALPVSPATHNPTRHPDRALRRRNLILGLMANQGMITRDEAAAARAFPIALREGARGQRLAPYFVEWVRQDLYRRYGTDVYEKGLRVFTTLDPELQFVADSVLKQRLDWVELQPAFRAPTYLETRDWPEDSLQGPEMPYVQGMFVALDPATGNILALVGGRDFGDSEFNRATQAIRQPGSVFKPFTYTAAIDAGVPASEVIYDTPMQLETFPGGPIYSPKNFDDEFHGPMTLRQALYQSINVVTVKLGQRVGIESVAQTARRMGIDSDIPRVASAPIGAGSVTPMEIATAYTTFANMGVRVTPRAILRIEDSDGRVLWESRVVRGDVVDRGTGHLGVRSATYGNVPLEVPIAGKTGTTNDATDTWFVGFSPELVTTTWIGFDRPARLHLNAYGGTDPAPAAGMILGWYYRDREPPAEWPRPPGLTDRTVDSSTGLLATPWCPIELTYTEVFLPGTEPTETCDVHGPWGIRQRADSLSIPPGEDVDWD